jgi:fido (protein-threonine AMPylation protein)
MGLSFDDLEGQTPLDEDEKLGLLIPTIATRGELDEFEQQNIELAIQWTLGRSLTPESIFTEKFIRMLHFRMYSKVWSWAGEFRKTNKNIGNLIVRFLLFRFEMTGCISLKSRLEFKLEKRDRSNHE